MAKSNLVSARRHPAGFLEGRARRSTGRHGEIVASFLQSDVQGDLATARELLEEIAAAERGEEPQPGGVGNAFSIAIAPDGAVPQMRDPGALHPWRVTCGDRDLDCRDRARPA
jgi:hypothetical protein